MSNGGQAGQKRQAEAENLKDQINEVATKWLQLVGQAQADKTLKQRLMDTPVMVLREHGINIPEGFKIPIVKNTDKDVYLTLPSDSRLTDRDLDSVVGGSVATIVKDAGLVITTAVSVVGSVVSAAANAGVFDSVFDHGFPKPS